MPVQPAAAIAEVVAIFDRCPDAREVARRVLALEREHAEDMTWLGAEWHDVGVAGHALARLVVAGLLVMPYRSRSTTTYRVADPEATEVALRAEIDPPMLHVEQGQPDDLFEIVVGLDDVKGHLRLCLAAERPVHALLVGSPGSAKSLLLAEIDRLPGSRFALGGSTSRAGIVERLLGDAPRYLILDELDKADGRDLGVLLSLMESGRVVVMKHGRQEERRLSTWVFAAANSAERLPRELLSRFLVLQVPDYDEPTYRAVAAGVLVAREGVDAELAQEIATLVGARSRDVRDAVRVARLCRGDRRLATELVAAIL